MHTRLHPTQSLRRTLFSHLYTLPANAKTKISNLPHRKILPLLSAADALSPHDLLKNL